MAGKRAADEADQAENAVNALVADGETGEAAAAPEDSQPQASAPDPLLSALSTRLCSWLESHQFGPEVQVEAVAGPDGSGCLVHVYGLDVVHVRSAATLLATQEPEHAYAWRGAGLTNDGQPMVLLTCTPGF